VTTSAVGLGSNLGDRRAHLGRAVAALEVLGERLAVSSLYESRAVGGPPQGDYLNAVVVVRTARSARGMLDGLLEIEREAGRVRGERWGPRIIDLDLLLHGDEVVEEPGLTVPHPRLGERRFVLEPLGEVWPAAGLPDGSSIPDLLDAVGGQDVRRVAGRRWWRTAGSADPGGGRLPGPGTGR
jgi:2-amino-4-hydroxy-6-hydroxymethyldihydropteridine diphosphokinase